MARTCFWSLGGVMLLGIACLASSFWIGSELYEPRPHGSPHWDVDWMRERDRREKLEERRQEYFRRDEKRKQLVQDVIDQRITLRQAAASLHDLESLGVSGGLYARLIGQLYPDKTLEDALCLKVISLVKEVLEREPDREARVLTRLREELEKGPEPPRSLSSPTMHTPRRAQE